MEIKKKWSLLLILFILPLFNVCQAETVQGSKDFEVYNLGEVVVSADKPKVNEIAITNEVTAEDIKATNSKTVAEALINAPGIRVTTGRKNEPNVSIHGFDQKQILVLIDGVPYYETNNGKLDLNQIPTDNIAKIEITKGAASVLYGANALGGVINIITRKPAEKPYTSAAVEFGENSSQRYSATHGMKVGIFNYWLNAGYQKSNGWNLSSDFKSKPGTISQSGKTTSTVLEDGGTRNNSDSTNKDFWAKVGLEPQKDSAYYLNFHYLNKDKGVPPSTISETVYTNRPAFSTFARIPKYEDWGIDLDGKQKVHEKWTLKAKLFYHNHYDDYVSYSDKNYTKPIAVSTYEDYILGGSFFSDFQPVAWDIIRMSLHYKGDSHKERDDTYLPFAESFSYTGSIGIENEFTRIKDLSVVAGISYDWYDVTKAEKNITDSKNGNFLRTATNPKPSTGEINPMIGLSYKLADATNLFGSLARKSRFPTLGQFYSSKGGNVNLASEKSLNYTLGVSRPFSTWARAEFSLFYHDVTDLISRDGPGTTATYRNYGNVQMRGFEVNVEVYPASDLTIRADYTYNNARDRSPGRVTEEVAFISQHKGDLGIQYRLPQIKTRIDFNTIYIGEAYSQLPTPQRPTQATLRTGDYILLNLKVTHPIHKCLEAYMAVNNMLDRDYETESGFPGPGRNFWVGLMARF